MRPVPTSATVSDRTRTALLVGLAAIVALGLRLLTYHTVLDGDTVGFVDPDAWYHMRLVDALIRDFPHRIWFDPYLRHPGGEVINVGPFFDWLIAAVALLLGGGSPDERLINVVGAFMPTIIGALTVIPVFVLGRELFSRRAGLWAAAVVGIVPGEILKRSLLGFTDHHCAEVLLSSLTLMFLVLALNATDHRRRLRHAALGGLSLGCYLLTWSGGALFVVILVLWLSLLLVVTRYRGETGTDIARVGLISLSIAAVMVLPWMRVTAPFAYQMVALGGGAVALLVLHALAIATGGRQRWWVAYLAVLAAVSALTVFAAVRMAPTFLGSVVGEVLRFSPRRTLALAGEATPLMLSDDRYPIPLWNQFTSSLFLAVFGMTVAVRHGLRRQASGGLLLFIWTSAMLAATIGQVRFAYYLAVNVALCAGFACDEVLALIQASQGPRQNLGETSRRHRAIPAVGGIVLVAVLVGPNLSRYQALASVQTQANPSWTTAMEWLRHNTPDPFGDPQRYFASVVGDITSGKARSTGSAYGVLSWWDYGYWIIRMGRRVPLANPRQTGVREVAEFLLATDETVAARMADALGARYVIVNAELQPRIGPAGEYAAGFLTNMAGAVGKTTIPYITMAYQKTEKGQVPVMLYHPAFYQSMLSRLYRSRPTVQTPDPVAAWVVTLEEQTDGRLRYWEVTKESSFTDYAAAQAAVNAAHSPNVRLVGKNPFVACLPLAPLREFVRVYGSLEYDVSGGQPGPAAIQIFEHRPTASRSRAGGS